MADTFWKSIPEHFENVTLDEYMVMPNHVHGILILLKADAPRRDVAVQRLYGAQERQTNSFFLSLGNRLSFFYDRPDWTPKIQRKISD